MPKKRKSSHKHNHHQSHQKKKFSSVGENMENTILALIFSSNNSIKHDKLHDKLIQKNFTEDIIRATLARMLKERLIKKDKKQSLSIAAKAPLFTGILTFHPKGFGFVGQTRAINNCPLPLRDSFIAPSRMAAAHHGDSVLIRVLRTRRDNRPEATILKVISTGTDKIIGTYMEDRTGARVQPDDPGYSFTIEIQATAGLRPQPGEIVIARYARGKKPTPLVKGVITEIIGPRDSVDTQMRIVIDKLNIAHTFSNSVIEQARRIRVPTNPEKNREDLRQTMHITIDGETAKDFDDAIYLEKEKTGYTLYVSIADVSAFVEPGSAIDKDAYARGTSIYFPGKVIPMLPERLSNDLCSLIPDHDRLTLTTILHFDLAGNLLKRRFTRSIIRSKHRFTYKTVHKILIEKDSETRQQHRQFLTMLQWARQLANILNKKRIGRGAINFDLHEAEITVNSQGRVDSIKRAERNFAHCLIEEFMIVANEAAAAHIQEQKLPALYRVHEAPAPEKTEDFLAFVQALGLSSEPFDNSPGWYARLLESCAKTTYNYLVNNLLLRSMQQAYYTHTNSGHFGLSSQSYTHFTSPIRRYPDLLLHRQLIRSIEHQTKTGPNQQTKTIEKDGVFLSARERVAVTAEREINNRLKLIYMEKKIGRSFTAVISGVNEYALFIEIQDLCISGSVAIELLPDDYYIFDEKRYRLFGEITGKIYQLGDDIKVTLINIDQPRKRLNFMPVADPDLCRGVVRK